MRIDLVTSVEGDEEVVAGLNRLAGRMSDLWPFWHRAARTVLRHNRKRWASALGWPRLDPDTIRRKVRERKDPRTLRATGALERALTVFGAPGQRFDPGPEEMRIGLDRQGIAFYGLFHQRGEGVPQRVVIRKTTTMRRDVRDALRDYVLGRV